MLEVTKGRQMPSGQGIPDGGASRVNAPTGQALASGRPGERVDGTIVTTIDKDGGMFVNIIPESQPTTTNSASDDDGS